MKIELDRYDLERLLMSSWPHDWYDPDPETLIVRAGYRHGSPGYQWNSLGNLTDEELWQLYQLCKNK